MATKTRNKLLRVGDLVKILDGTHDPNMPAHRTGLIVEVVESADQHHAPLPNVLYRIQFGPSILKFHPMWVEKIS
jgi:hypothetical protein